MWLSLKRYNESKKIVYSFKLVYMLGQQMTKAYFKT